MKMTNELSFKAKEEFRKDIEKQGGNKIVADMIWEEMEDRTFNLMVCGNEKGL